MIELNVNSYVTLEEADTYFAQRLGADYWATLEDAQKEKSLITATKKIDRLPFIGYKQNPSQPLQFPRFYYNSCSYNGLQIADIPPQLKEAVCEEALTELQYLEANSEDVFNNAMTGSYQALKLGDASITYGNSSDGNQAGQTNYKGIMSQNAADLLQGLVKVGFNITNSYYYEVY